MTAVHCDLSQTFAQAQQKLEMSHTSCTPLACTRRLLYQTLLLCVFEPCRSSPNKFCTFSHVICAQTAKKDLCLIIRGKNHTNLTTAFAPIVLLLSPSPAWNVMLLPVHAVCPHPSQLIWFSLPSSSSILHFLAYLTLSSLLNLCTAFIKTHS